MAPKDFGWAIMQLKKGLRVQRESWNGKGMYLFLMTVEDFDCDHMGEDGEVRPCIAMHDAQGKVIPGWLASQTDMLAEDWDMFEPSV